MKPSRILLAAVCAAAVAGATTLTAVFGQQSEMVTVNINDVANNVATNINTETSQIPLTVQAPVDVAAKVCGLPPDVLAKLTAVGEGCTATTSSPALELIVQTQIKAKKR